MSALLTEKLGLGISPTLLGNQMVVEARAKGEKVLHMGFGESPFPVPERLAKALAANTHHKQYIKTAGLPELCDQILTYYQNKAGINKDDYDCLIAPGSKLIIYAMQLAIPGDLVHPVPSWVSYEPQAKLVGSSIIKVPTTLNDEGYQIDPEDLKETIAEARANGKNPTKIILNTPNNPTGLMIPEENMKDIAAVCEEENIVIIADEIYGEVTFDGSMHSFANFAPGRTVISSAVSKHLSLGGWRLGFGLIPKAQKGLYMSLCQIASELWSCVAGPIQYALIEAYKGHQDIEDHIKACTAIHKYVNSYIGKELKKLGLELGQPQGGFYIYPNFAPFKDKLNAKGIKTSTDLFQYLLKNHNLATLPGEAFGENPETLTLRLSGCDYDGAKALAAYQAGETLDQKFLEAHTPNIIDSVKEFGRFLDK